MECWVRNEATASAVIKFADGVFRVVDKKELSQFGERDIYTMAHHQIVCNREIFEVAVKEFTGMIVDIIEKKMWLGTMGRFDVLVIEQG